MAATRFGQSAYFERCCSRTEVLPDSVEVPFCVLQHHSSHEGALPAAEARVGRRLNTAA